MNIFEFAVRNKMRFPFKGLISTEDVFDLSLEQLDSIFKTLNAQTKQAEEESLLNVKTKENEELSIKIEIIKYIVKDKLDKENARLQEKEKRERKQKIMGILANKQDAELLNKTPEELEKMLNELE